MIDRQMDTQIDKEIVRQIDRKRDIQIDSQIYRQLAIDRQKYIQIDRKDWQIDRQSEIEASKERISFENLQCYTILVFKGIELKFLEQLYVQIDRQIAI